MASTGCSTFPSTMRVIHGVHHNTSNSWTETFPALAACLAHVHIHVFAVADYTDSGQAFDAHFADFPRLQLELCVILIFCLLYTSPSPRDGLLSRMPSSA